MYDLLIKNLQVVQAQADRVDPLDIAIKDGRFAALEPSIDPGLAQETVDGSGLTAFPGVIDVHMHVGIYSPLEQDAVSESKAAVMGGVTTGITYFRTGQYYLNKGGPYADFYPEVLDISSGEIRDRHVMQDSLASVAGKSHAVVGKVGVAVVTVVPVTQDHESRVHQYRSISQPGCLCR